MLLSSSGVAPEDEQQPPPPAAVPRALPRLQCVRRSVIRAGCELESAKVWARLIAIDDGMLVLYLIVLC